MKLKKWVRVVLTLILMLIGIKLYYSSNEFAVTGKTNIAVICWMIIVVVIPYTISHIWE